MIGHGLARVTSAIFDEGDVPPPINVIMYWLPLKDMSPACGTMIMKGDLKHPQINISFLDPQYKDFYIEDLAGILKKDSRGFQTNIVYLHDADWKIHSVDVKQKTVGTDHVYEIEISPDQISRQSCSGRREKIRLWEKNGNSLQEQPPTSSNMSSLQGSLEEGDRKNVGGVRLIEE